MKLFLKILFILAFSVFTFFFPMVAIAFVGICFALIFIILFWKPILRNWKAMGIIGLIIFTILQLSLMLNILIIGVLLILSIGFFIFIFKAFRGDLNEEIDEETEELMMYHYVMKKRREKNDKL